MKGVKFHPCLILGAHFQFKLLSTVTFYCQNLMKINNLHALKGPCRFYKGLTGAHLRLKRAQSRPERGPSKLKWAKNACFSFLGAGHLHQGALPWLISPPSPELWLRYCKQTDENRAMRMPSWQKDNEQIISYLMVTGLQLTRE